jgi:threonine aldolase
LFDRDLDTFLVFNGTGANVFALEILKRPASAVLCTDIAHIYTMETGAPTKITGMELITLKSNDGKMNINELQKSFKVLGDVHYPQPKIVSITQVTESGSVYTLDELKEISKISKKNNAYLHIDGSRISNALLSMGLTPKEFIAEVEPDVLIFGGTKNGLMFGEAILVFNKSLAENCIYLRKQTTQLMSKMKFLSAQFIPYIKDNLWYKNAKNSNDMAKYLKTKLKELDIEIVNSVDANILFVKLPKRIIEPLREYSYFYIWNDDEGICRLITNFDTEKSDIDGFIDKIKSLLK